MSSENSPKKKKMKLDSENCNKRASENINSDSKRVKKEDRGPVDINTLKRKNFVTACEMVSCKAYFDYQARLQLIYLPPCIHRANCKHQDFGKDVIIGELPNYIEEAVKIETKTNGWCDALEVCQMSIMSDQYLSATVLKEIIEIMLNCHEDTFADYSTDILIDKCQQILSQNFSTHPPCLVKSLRTCYTNFLTSAMDSRDKTFTNRSEFEYNKGIVKYCMNRLEYEISVDSKDGPLVEKELNIPKDLKESVKGLHWQKEKFEIFEVLDRPNRIQRLMAVLESIIELMQFDLAIWHSRHTNNLSNHIMRSNKPLMAIVLWNDNILYTGGVNSNCRQILKLFVHVVHLEYPQRYIQIMTTWLNVIIQTFYVCETHSNSDYPNTGKYCAVFAKEFYKIIAVYYCPSLEADVHYIQTFYVCETHSNSDYPNTGKYCAVFAKEFYKIIADLPYSSIIRVLEHIEPPFMRQMIGTLHLQTLLVTPEENIINIFIQLIKKDKLDQFKINCNSEISIAKYQTIRPGKNAKNPLKQLKKASKNKNEMDVKVSETLPKLEKETFLDKIELDQKYIVHVLYVTIEACLDSYNIYLVQENIDKLNEQLEKKGFVEDLIALPEYSSYSVTEHFIKKYRTLFESLTELIVLLKNLKQSDVLPELFYIFDKIGLIDDE